MEVRYLHIGEIDLKIIEFNGVPGCGKSTVCQEMYQYYKENTDQRIIYYENPLHKNIIVKFSQCFYILCKALIVKKQRKFLLSSLHFADMMLRQNGLSINILCQLQYIFKTIIIADYCEKWKRDNRTDIILIDQGITQYIVSALYGIKYKRESIGFFFSEICFYSDDCYVIECIADIKRVVNRLQKRENGKSRIERLCCEKWEEELLQQRKIFDDMRQEYSKYIKNTIRIDTTENLPYENSQIVIAKAGGSFLG